MDKFVLQIFILLGVISSCIALYENCDNVLNLSDENKHSFTSPSFPLPYAAGSSCRYVIRAPSTYQIELKCVHMMDLFHSEACDSNFMIVSDEYDPNFTISNRHCGFSHFTKFSLYNEMTLAYISNSTGGYFKCHMRAFQQPCECGWTVTTKIVGGTVASTNELPSHVGIQDKTTKEIFCGGAIINYRYVLTAAHCFSLVNNPTQILIIAGEQDITKTTETIYTRQYGVQKIIKHPQYSTTTQLYDIALVQTLFDITYTRGVGPACLPNKYSANSFVGSKVEIAGWGTTSFGGPTSNVLLKTMLDIVAASNCASFTNYNNTQQLCTKTTGKDSCQLDSGGSLYFRDTRIYTVGLISYGTGCTGAAVNTRVTSMLNWIYTNSNGLYCDV